VYTYTIMSLVEVLNDQNEYEPISDRFLPASDQVSASRKRRRVWPIPLFTGGPSYEEQDPGPPPSSPTPSEDPGAHAHFEIPSAPPPPIPPPTAPSSSWMSSSVSSSSSSNASKITSNNYSVDHINPYRRFHFEKRHKRALTIQDIYNSSDDEDEDELKAERALARKYLNKRFGLRGDDESSSSSDDDDEEGEVGTASERKKALEAKVQAYRAKCGHDMNKVRRKREKFWKMRDIQKKWCAICALQHKSKAGERFQDIGQLERYWLENLGRMSIEKTIKSIHIYHLAECRPFYLKRSIDPYTGLPKPAHWWSPISIAEHFMEHDCHPYTFNVLQLQKAKDLLAQCEAAMPRFDVTIGTTYLDHRTFLQRKALLLQIHELQTHITRYKEQSSATHSLITAMNAASR
jgi:hypothetical protein